MNAAMVSSLMSKIPERVARQPSGSPFLLGASPGPQIAYLVPLLSWLTPLACLSKDDQRALGLAAPQLRAMALEEEEKDVDPDATLPPSSEFEVEEDLDMDGDDAEDEDAEELEEIQLSEIELNEARP